MSEKYASKSTDKIVFHSSKQCERIDDPGRFFERDDRYVEWHDLDPCPFCCGDDFPQPNQPQQHDESIYQAAKAHGDQ